jgi:hypothetical protein
MMALGFQVDDGSRPDAVRPYRCSSAHPVRRPRNPGRNIQLSHYIHTNPRWVTEFLWIAPFRSYPRHRHPNAIVGIVQAVFYHGHSFRLIQVPEMAEHDSGAIDNNHSQCQCKERHFFTPGASWRLGRRLCVTSPQPCSASRPPVV